MSTLTRTSLASLSFLLLAACSSSSSSNNPGNDTGVVDDDTGSGSDTGVPAGACAVIKTGTAGTLLRGTLLMTDAPLDGELMIDATGKIACVGASCASTAGYDQTTQIACDGVISPGLINAHDHEEYDTAGPYANGTTRWKSRSDWRAGADGGTKLSTPGKSVDPKSMGAQELRQVLAGTTSNVTSSTAAVPGFVRNLAEYKLDATLEGLTGPSVYFDTFPLGDTAGGELTTGCAYPSPTASTTAFSGGKAFTPHFGEGLMPATENEIVCALGSLALITKQTGIIHGISVNAKDVDAIAKTGASLVWSPRTNTDLYGDTAPVTEYKNAGITIALGTDWLFSGSMNMLRELKCADSLNQKYFNKAFSDKELWMMATKNASVITHFDNQIGELKVGLFADVAVFSGATKDYRAVIDAGIEDVRLVMRGGKVLFGDAPIVTALAQSCTALDVCGTPRQVCVDVPSVSLADLQASAASVYPLFYCKTDTPKNEPTCVPYRDTFPDGTSATDRDGDGVADTTDLCPDVFDPIRPMDGTTQADVDGDGAGDACDSKPLDPATK
jgi:cytosine/adenosine deaminase-related metal-dependent hydrolase